MSNKILKRVSLWDDSYEIELNREDMEKISIAYGNGDNGYYHYSYVELDDYCYGVYLTSEDVANLDIRSKTWLIDSDNIKPSDIYQMYMSLNRNDKEVIKQLMRYINEED